ncbi:MAG: TVP38/TMEM64 family protein [Lachnospiraceae bacterium]
MEESVVKEKNYFAMVSKYLSIATIILCVLFAFWGYQLGIFKSQESLSNFIRQTGIWAPLIFTLIQLIQVIIPVLPGFVTCVVGAIAFGPVLGFLYSYIGICAGSILAFLIARRYGVGCVKKIIGEHAYDKYIRWLEKGNKFNLLFGLAIFLPAAPDDVLCFIAGLTRMSTKKFVTIILLGKPFVIILYCLAVAGVITLPAFLG